MKVHQSLQGRYCCSGVLASHVRKLQSAEYYVVSSYTRSLILVSLPQPSKPIIILLPQLPLDHRDRKTVTCRVFFFKLNFAERIHQPTKHAQSYLCIFFQLLPAADADVWLGIGCVLENGTTRKALEQSPT